MTDGNKWKPGNRMLIQMTLISSACTQPGSACTTLFAADTASNAPTLRITAICNRPPNLMHIYTLLPPDRSLAAREGGGVRGRDAEWIDKGLVPVRWNETGGKSQTSAMQ